MFTITLLAIIGSFIPAVRPESANWLVCIPAEVFLLIVWAMVGDCIANPFGRFGRLFFLVSVGVLISIPLIICGYVIVGVVGVL